MKLISHRGNYNGILPDRENKPTYIDTMLSMNYDVEIDVRFIEGQFYLGHDTPDTFVSENWILARKNRLWFHCKDLYSAQQFYKMNCGIQYFCHTSDNYVLTSTGHIWVHDLNLKLDETCIIPLLDEKSITEHHTKNVYAICTDFISIYKNIK